MRYAATLLWTIIIGACSGPSVEPPKNSVSSIPQAEGSEPPPIPTVQTVADSVPWPVATLSGTALGARRVIIESGLHAWARAVLPDGAFCMDVPMDEEGAHDFTVWAQSEDGTLSAMPAMVAIAYDPAAPEPPGATRCDGTPIAECAAAAEICDNDVDDDCNGLLDGVDPDCSTCSNDFFEPNDRPDAPRIEPGTYEGLNVCAGNADFYRVRLAKWDRLTVRARFTHADGDIDLRLLGPDGTTRIESSVSVTDDEEILYTAEEDGDYVVQVYGFAEAENGYTLELLVD